MKYSYRNDIHRELHSILCAETTQRDVRGFPDWVKAERAAMCDAINRLRARLGKPPVALSDVEAVEQLAVGHVDYGTKFALYCTQLVEDRA